MKTAALLIGLLVSVRLCVAQEKPDQKEKRIWGYSHLGEYRSDGKDTRLEFGGVSQDLEHLVGTFVLARQRDGAPLMIHGHSNKSGEFTPNVSLEVSDAEDGNWKVIESSLSDKPDVTLKAAPHIGHLLLRIQFDALQPYIGKFKFFRVVLQTGETDVTPMTWLTEEGHP
jgi:hypothetical protein